MIMQKKTKYPTSFLLLVQNLVSYHHCGWGFWAFVGTLVFLALLSGANFHVVQKIYTAGQVAESDVIADRDIMVEDTQATEARRKQLLLLQPPVYDLSLESSILFQNRILELFQSVNENNKHADADGGALAHLIDDLTPAVVDEILPELALPDVQTYILKELMPLIHTNLAEGLVGDIRSARVGRAGAVIHNLDTKVEVLRPDVGTLHDVQSFLAEISSKARQELSLTPQSRRAVNILLSATMPASLTLNREATQKRAEAVIESVKPIYYQIQKGEIIAHKGERVSREQQIKLQTLYQTAASPMRWVTAVGALLCALLFSIGFFVAPSGRPGTSLLCKDILMISLMLLLFGTGAKAVYQLYLSMNNDTSLLHAFSAAFPVAGAVGLVAMVFAARCYCVMGLLLAFFCMLMFQADYVFFIYHFLGGMLATWLVIRAQSRQDVVWSIIPLTIGQSVIWLGTALLAQTPVYEAPAQLIAVAVNSLFSLILLFAVSPVLEMVFDYSTRFRLMELMNLEQPLMQELMVTIPGTYHHSLVVANMVEAGAKAIGANSLLCKVAALYHDVGKLSYPEYFIENLYGSYNKHDKLSPSMSALVLLSHVKKGTELAERYKLGQEIADIIRQHHGTRLIRYFYQKALNLGEKPRDSDYSYPGPRPQTREAAILMLADSVEASSRTLTDPTPSRLKSHIDATVKGIFSEGQLDESELTFKDLHYLSKNFQRILTGIFHQRIVYPEQSKIQPLPAASNLTDNSLPVAADKAERSAPQMYPGM
ncbi:HD family phosphohydrolase [Candidatus Desulfovibrio trichonymphae]|uniref:Membrane-associated HD superfamily hydrolase n=1 Tax=Candidatus Desulfovibrio trichonymphae TaxID=1725232 RepID=A0A1J1DVJ3_9BACT|nr:HDIG domain-containing metalloprotein [Candidatus Desulfovibrio trichonymphae]BAV91884.1 membrane-associated HD superfamily hydrolase [Candidatus Desulfovibrio trichonymphae]